MPARVPEVLPADEHNRVLVENAHPPDWQNQQPSGRYNLVVIGAGTAGLVATAGAATLGAKVALIERHLMGGDCLNYGCVPSKALIRAARAAYAASDAARFGIAADVRQIDFAAAMRWVRSTRAQISVHDSARRFSGLGAGVFLGDAHFVSKHAVEIEGARVEFSKAIIATGARAAQPDIPGLKEAGYLTNETVFSITALPARLVVIGGGPIGCELAQGFRRLGSEVSVIGHASRLLPREEAEASALLTRQFQQEGIALFLAAQVLRVEQTKSGKRVFFESHNGSKEVVCDEILVAVGRAPNVEGLGLEAAGVAYDRRGVIVDDHLRTSNPDIYAAGDIASRFKFTHAAEALARIALQNALFFGRKKAGSLVIPWCTYTDPEVAHVGLYAKEAQERGIEFETVHLGLDDNDRAVTDGETEGFIRVLMAKKSRQLVGATLVSTHAGESIGELVLAIERKLRLSDLSGVIHPYPTQADVIKRAGDASMKSRLKPWMKRLLTKIFEWRR